jgi:predicted CXXCH cytochrome family protein
MRTLRVVLLLLAAVALLPAASRAATTPGSGIQGTKHDFSGKGTPPTGLCTFCHTPHKALQTPLLWNHALSVNTFLWDVPATTAGTSFPTTMKGDTYKGPTAKCLSCHDGSVAIGDVAWFNAGKPAVLDATKITGAAQMATVTGGMAGNHPVAMPYPFNQQRNTYNGVQTGAGFVSAEWQSDPTLALNIRLFNDDGTGNISAGPVATKTGIECSSCHDPHNKASTGDFLLRGTLGGNTTAYICLKCHIK